MSNWVRILLRLLGAVLFAASLLGIVLFLAAGPVDVAEKMGKSCRHNNQLGPSEWCTWRDALGILQMLPFTLLVGGVLMVVFRSDKKRADGTDGTPTLDLSGSGRSRLGSLGGLGALAVIAIVVVSFPTVFIYRWTFTIGKTVAITKKVLDAPGPDFSQKSKPAPQKADAPKGLSRGSLLRTASFRTAVGQIRRVAPAGARLSALRVSAEAIDAELLAGGKTLKVHKAWNGKARVTSKAPATPGDEPLIAFSELAAAAPQRVVTAAARATDQRAGDIDYLVLINVIDLRWNAFLEEGRRMVAVSADDYRASLV